MTKDVFNMTINKETLNGIFTSFIRAMGYITPQQSLDIENLTFDQEDQTTTVEGGLVEETMN